MQSTLGGHGHQHSNFRFLTDDHPRQIFESIFLTEAEGCLGLGKCIKGVHSKYRQINEKLRSSNKNKHHNLVRFLHRKLHI